MSAFKHHPKLYLPYGDLVIASAPNASEESTVTLFRVSKGILAYNSPVFADMLTFPTGNSNNDSVNEMHEGVPVVRVTDTAQELEAMLKVLYEPATLVLPRLDPNTPLVVRDVFKLASKYQMSAIRKAIVDILEDTWPHTFYGWLRYQADLRMAEKTHFLAGGRIDGKSLDERFPEPASAVRLAHDCDIPRILPFAYYELGVALTNEDWDAVRRDEELTPEDFTRRTVRWGILGRDELWRVMRGREELSVEGAALKVWFKQMSPLERAECATPNECSDKFKAFASERIDDDSLWMMYDALNLLEILYNGVKEASMCDRCRSAVMAAVRGRERVVWDELPELFGLPDWNEVEP